MNLFVLFCVLLWGVWGIAMKRANTFGASPAVVTVVMNFFYFLVSLAFLSKTTVEEWRVLDVHVIWWSVAVAIASVSAKFFFNSALQKGDASVIIPVTSSGSIIVTMVIASLFLGEQITFFQALGGVLIAVGVALLA
jgi:drug/metabolite transporter (DMT)-like permease